MLLRRRYALRLSLALCRFHRWPRGTALFGELVFLARAGAGAPAGFVNLQQ